MKISALMVLLVLFWASDFVKAKRPNILFIMSDDHTSQAVGAYGSRLAKLNPTPTIDRLAKEGMLFENAFCSNAICAPSRATILTGQYAHTCGVHDLRGSIEAGRQFLAIEMKKAGYQTAMIGKWHLKKEPADFDYYCVLPGQGKYHDPEFRIRGEKKWPKNLIKFEGEHSSDAITDQTLKWLKEGRDDSKPFFLMHHYKAPHDYFEHSHRYNDYLANVDIPKPDNLHKSHPAKFGSIATRGYQDELVPHIGTSIGNRNPRRSYAIDLPQRFPQDYPNDYDPSKLSDREIKDLSYNVYLRKYLRCVKGIDDNLKRLFDYMEKNDLMEDTVIIYTGDQGFMLGEHDYQDKRWMYEESMRMPFLIRYPKTIKSGLRTDSVVSNVDYAPTILDFAGVKKPEYMQGRSFKSICETGKEPKDWSNEAYYRYWMHMAHHDNPGHVGIRTKEFKLIYYYGADYQGKNQTPPAWELYDMKKDPFESNNLYDDPMYKEKRENLKKRLSALRKKVGDDGQDFPKTEDVIKEFWDYDADDREKARKISGEFLKLRLTELKNPKAKKN